MRLMWENAIRKLGSERKEREREGEKGREREREGETDQFKIDRKTTTWA